jgi:acyl-CoA reductase-like NAD-dependent aldehyde dehydrogenase
VKPTVFVNVRNDMTIAREEIFGPVLCVIAYDSEDEAIRIANDSNYGLHAAVLGADLQRARRVASQMRPGEASNTPGWAVNTADTGSRRFSKPAPSLSPEEAHP